MSIVAVENAIKTAVKDTKDIVNEILRRNGIAEYNCEDLIGDVESHLREQCDWRYRNGFWIGIVGRRLLKDDDRRNKVKDLLLDLRASVSPKDILYWITLCSTVLLIIEELQILDYKLVIAFCMGFALCFLTGGLEHPKEKKKCDKECDKGVRK